MLLCLKNYHHKKQEYERNNGYPKTIFLSSCSICLQKTCEAVNALQIPITRLTAILKYNPKNFKGRLKNEKVTTGVKEDIKMLQHVKNPTVELHKRLINA